MTALRDAEALRDAGLIEPHAVPALARVAERYAVALTPAVAALIDPTDPADPIAAQFVPDPRELVGHPDELADPIGDHVRAPVPGIVHRYPDRVLLKLVQVCPVYCRFCFRRETVGPGASAMLPAADLDRAIDYIASRREIWEVILTGGDPLVLAPRRLGAVMEKLKALDHVRVVRLHTRVPVVDPARIDAALIAALDAFGRAVFVALHANHPRELTAEARAACGRLIDAGIPMVSQSVLLRGINDDPATLEALMRAFVETRIKPYYLHHADLAPGTSRFRTSLEEGRSLVGSLRGHVSGLCQPTYVLDIPGGHGKAVLNEAAARRSGENWSVVDHNGRVHGYRDALDCGQAAASSAGEVPFSAGAR